MSFSYNKLSFSYNKMSFFKFSFFILKNITLILNLTISNISIQTSIFILNIQNIKLKTTISNENCQNNFNNLSKRPN